METTNVLIYKSKENYQIKIQSQSWELNIWLGEKEFHDLKGIRDTNWNERKTIQAGKSAGSDAFWCFSEGEVCILIGDDESWDFAVHLPFVHFKPLMEEKYYL